MLAGVDCWSCSRVRVKPFFSSSGVRSYLSDGMVAKPLKQLRTIWNKMRENAPNCIGFDKFVLSDTDNLASPISVCFLCSCFPRVDVERTSRQPRYSPFVFNTARYLRDAVPFPKLRLDRYICKWHISTDILFQSRYHKYYLLISLINGNLQARTAICKREGKSAGA